MSAQGSAIEELLLERFLGTLRMEKGKLKNNKEVEAIITSACQFMKPLPLTCSQVPS
jgi:hypothetical protein